MKTLWTLTLILNFGMTNQKEVVISHTIPSWFECFVRANHEIILRKNPYTIIGARCEPSLGEVA